jgi:hypothetical protein
VSRFVVHSVACSVFHKDALDFVALLGMQSNFGGEHDSETTVSLNIARRTKLRNCR